MNAEELIALAAGRGIDLKAAAEARTDTSRHADAPQVREYVRRGVRIFVLEEPSGSRAYGRPSQSAREIEWGSQEVGLALAGLGAPQTMAALYSYAGHEGYYWPLADELLRVALRFRSHLHWAPRVPGEHGQDTPYIEALCSMVLDDDRYPGVLDYAPEPRLGEAPRRGLLRAAYCAVTLPIWRTRLADKYALIRDVYWRWLDDATRRVQVKLRAGEDET